MAAIRAGVREALTGCSDWRYSSGQGCTHHETQKVTPFHSDGLGCMGHAGRGLWKHVFC
jgi:hypothetical protein